MSTRDPRVDAYIAGAAPFAQPILAYLRALVHETCPDIEETMKWGAPAFVHAGALLCGMAAFKRHAAFGFWKHALVVGGAPREGMGSFGKLASIRDLPPKRTLAAHLRKAMALNDAGTRAPRTRKTAAPKPPPDLEAALRGNDAARRAFDAFAPSHRREYVDWIAEAKRPETRARRLSQAIARLAEGKTRHWKYARS